MIACPQCNTFNPEGEQACLSCESSLSPARTTSTRSASAPSTVQGGARCRNGHPVDPRWSSCPYCTHGGTLDRATRLETGPSEPAKTRLDLPQASAGTQRTVLRSSGPPAPSELAEASPSPPREASRPVSTLRAAPAASDPREDTRPLVGVLAAPDAGPAGLIFPLRVGKNRIGGAPGCEIRLGQDPQVSGEHALILHRGGGFYLNDRMSTNGTFLNGQEIDPSTNATPLEDRDRIRCGDTEMVLLVLDRAAAGG